MGWFFNKDYNSKTDQESFKSQQGQQQKSKSFFQSKSTSSFSSKKRKCQNDPNDDQYLICKTVIKDNTGTRQEQQRIPRNGRYGGTFSETESFSSTSSNFRDPFSSSKTDLQNDFQRLKSFFFQPNLFDLHNSTTKNITDGQNHQQNYLESQSYSQVKVCQQDPEDNQYLICKSKFNDGHETKQVQQRIKLSDTFRIPTFKGQFSNVGALIDKDVNDMLKDINIGFNSLMPLMGAMMGLGSFVNPEQYSRHFDSNGQRTNRNYQNSQEYDKTKYFNTNNEKKDTSVYDL